MTDLLTKDELAELLNITPRRVYDLTRQRTNQKIPIPVIRIGSTLRFRRADIELWLEQLAKGAV
jgi:excisionase family DNA binding protein